MAKRKMSRILSAHDKEIRKTYGANGALSKLWRQILFDLNINNIRFESLMDDFLNHWQHGHPGDRKKQASLKGNINKEFEKEKMTWRVFCKAMSFLKLRGFRLVIEAEHQDRSKSKHEVPIILQVDDEDGMEQVKPVMRDLTVKKIAAHIPIGQNMTLVSKAIDDPKIAAPYVPALDRTHNEKAQETESSEQPNKGI